MEAYITALAAFLPNAPVSNDAIEDVLGRIGGRPSRNKDLILARNGIVHRPSALDPQTGRLTHTNAELTAEAVQRLVDCEEIAWGETDFWRAERRRPIRSFPAMRRWFTNLAARENTGAAAIFIMLEELLASGRVQDGDRILCSVPESSRFTCGYIHLTAVAG